MPNFDIYIDSHLYSTYLCAYLCNYLNLVMTWYMIVCVDVSVIKLGDNPITYLCVGMSVLQLVGHLLYICVRIGVSRDLCGDLLHIHV